MTPLSASEMQELIKTLKNSTLPTDRKKYYIEIVEKYGELPPQVRLELENELKAEISLIDELLDEFPTGKQIENAIELTKNERHEEALLTELDQKIKKLEQLRYEFEDRLAAVDEFYDPLLEEVSSAESKRKLREEKNLKIAAIEEEYKKIVKDYQINP